MNINSFRLITGLMTIALLWVYPMLYAAEGRETANPASAVADLQMSIGNAAVAKSGSFCVPVKVNSFTNILGIELTITYDTTKLVFTGVQNLNLVGMTETSSFGLPGSGINPKGTLKLSWLDPNVSGVTIADGTTIFQMCFTAANVDATTTINFGSSAEILDANENILNLAKTPGTITIGTGSSTGGGGTGGGTGGGGTGGGTTTTGFAMAVGSDSVAQGVKVCLPVTVQGFTDILGIELTFTYNPAKLTYHSVANLNLAGLTESSSFGVPGSGINPLGTLKLSWLDPNVVGVTVANGTKLFDVCFTTASVNDTAIVGFAASREILNASEEIISFTGTPGVVKIGTGSSGGGTGGGGTGGGGTGGGGTGGSTVGTGTFGLYIGDTSTSLNQSFCLPVKSGSFRDILGIELTMNYASAALRFDSVARLNLNGLTSSSFGLPGVGVNPLGAIKLSWTDPNVTGISVFDSTTVFELCFTAVQNNVTTSVSFNPTVEIIDKNEMSVGFAGDNGTVVIGTGAGGTAGTGPFTLDITDASAQAGSEVCLPVIVTNFSNILGMEFSITYDSTKLEFSGVNSLNLSGLTAEGNFGFPGVGTTRKGTLKVSWNDPDVAGISLNDGTTLFKVCFTAIGSNTTTSVGFSSTSEIIKGDASTVSLTASPGTVTISGQSVNTFGLLVDSGSALPGQEVCLDVRVNKFTNLIGAEFSIAYDSTKLEFKQVTGFGALRGMDGGVFGLPGIGTNKKGSIKVSWVDPEVSGVTLANGTSIFRVCFTARGALGSTTNVSVAAPIEIINVSGQSVSYSNTAGVVTFGTPGENNQLQFVVSDAAVARNSDVCLNVSAQNFTSVVGMEFTMKYRADSLTFKALQGFNLSGLDQSSFNTATSGKIKLSWYDPEVSGITLPANTNLFQVCFTTKSLLGMTQVTLDSTQTIEVTDINDQAVPFAFDEGLISILTNALPPLVVDSVAQITHVTCFGQNVGAVNISVQGGSGSYTYKWSYQNATTQDLVNLPAGTYSVTVTDATTQISVVKSFTVQGPSSALAVALSGQSVTCFDSNDGKLSATPTGGTSPYVYAWSGGLPALSAHSNVLPGLYYVTVTDAKGCIVTSDSFRISRPASALAVVLNSQNATCIGINNGQVSAVASGGSTPYAYAWSNNLPANQMSHSNVAVGQYRVTVTDARGCAVSAIGQVGQSAGVSITSVQTTPIDAGSDGAVNVTVAGGQTPYAFSWTGPGGYSRATEDISGVGVEGSYCFRVSDSQGCYDTTCVSVLKRLKFSNAIVRDACFETANGSVVVDITGGKTPYQFLWSNGAITQNLDSVRGGAYRLTVTDATGTTLTGSFDVPELSGILINATFNPSRGPEGTANGSIVLSVSGGEAPYTYKWNNNAVTATLSNLAKGEYCVTVTDAKGCTMVRCIQIELVSLPLAIEATVTNNKCFGQTQGIIQIQVTGGLAPYFALFNDGVRVDANSSGVVERKNLAAGTYTYVITDKEGSTKANSSLITQPTAVSIMSTVVKHDNDAPGCTGGITITVGGGASPYFVRWNSNNAGLLITNLCEGQYVPTVEDANGCMVTFDPIEINTFTFLGQIVDNVCPGDAGGDVNLNIAGGAAPYTYFWLNSKGDTISRTKDLSNVVSGTYRAIVKESSGNSLLKEFAIGTKSSLSARALVTSNFRTYGVSCRDAADGVIEATALNGIGVNYIYAWLLDEKLVGSEQKLTKAAAGTYKVQVTDEAGCMTEAMAELTAPPLLGVSGSVNHISCVGARDGDILVSASGGVPGSIYTYRWSTGATGPRISFLTKGNYTASVTDANNCTVSGLFTVLEPQAMVVSVETTPATVDAPDCDGAARVTVTGGTRPYAYVTNVPNAKSTDSVFIKLCPGDYALEIVDSRGCKTSPERMTFTILDRTLPCLDARTVITPDGDGANETLEIRCIEELTDNRIFIFNEWGQKVFEAQNYNNNWNGTTQNGEELPEGAYFYVLEYTDINSERVQIKGSITLLR